MALLGLLTLAVWPDVVRQLGLVIGYPRPLRIDYLLLAWAAVPWVWSHPAWFEWRTWGQQLSSAARARGAAIGAWWSSPRRWSAARDAAVRGSRAFLGLA